MAAKSLPVDPPADPPADDRPHFARISRNQSLADKVAEKLTDEIIAGHLPPGSRLPSERELGQQFGVSRSVVREALRALVAKSLVVTHMRQGLQVREAGSKAVAESMALYLRGNSLLGYANVQEVRHVLEVQIAGLAAERISDDQIHQLTNVTDQLRQATDARQAARADIAFHQLIAEATGNPLLLGLLDSIAEVMLGAREAGFTVPGTLEYSIQAHAGILERIANHDVDGACQAMTDHLKESTRRLAKATSTSSSYQSARK